jgi:hypothetical protein
MTWSNVTSGSYALSACASDANGMSVTSAVVAVTVSPISISITNPVNNIVFVGNETNINLAAVASDVVGNIEQVQFFSGPTNLATLSGPPYTLTISNANTGNYAFTAVATDDNGIVRTSAVEYVTISPLFESNNLSLWLNATSLSGLTNNSPVITWPDISGWSNPC